MKVCNGPSKASNLDKLMSNNASVCHADFHNHSITITLNKFTEQLDVTLNQFEYQSQCLQLVTFTSLLFHYLSTRHCDTLQQQCIHVNATSHDVNQISNDHNTLRLHQISLATTWSTAVSCHNHSTSRAVVQLLNHSHSTSLQFSDSIHAHNSQNCSESNFFKLINKVHIYSRIPTHMKQVISFRFSVHNFSCPPAPRKTLDILAFGFFLFLLLLLFSINHLH